MTDITPELLGKSAAQQQMKAAEKKEETPPSGEGVSEKPLLNTAEQAFDPNNFVQEIKDDDGTLLQRIPFKDGAIHGNLELFNDGHLMQSIPYEEGIVTGWIKGFDPQGALMYEIPVTNNKTEGVSTMYMNGVKASETTFENDAMNGPLISFHPNGLINSEGTYKDNHLIRSPFMMTLGPFLRRIPTTWERDGSQPDFLPER